VQDLEEGTYVVILVVPPPMVADAGPSSADVLSFLKWFTASVVVLWQVVHARLLCSEMLCLLDVGPLYCVVPYTWQLEHWVLTVSVPVRQFGATCPPWQLTFVQRSRDELSNAAAPVFAL
jgi:hypothetical protein